jgi:acyl-CoA synthetase (AMP-forming)/AMP-acid ligase II
MNRFFELGDEDSDETVYAAFERTRRRFGQSPFIHIPKGCPGGPLTLTYEQAGLRAEGIADRYRRAGYGRGHHIALLLESRPEFYLHWLALNAVGATLVPIGADLVDDEIRMLLQHGDVDLAVCLSSRLASLERAVQGGCEAQIASLGSRDEPFPPAREPRSDGAASAATAMVFTSGSTGAPKGCLLSNEYFLTFGRWYRDLGGRCALRAGCERFITPLPPNHVNALAFSSMGAIVTGGCIIQLDRFRSGQWWEVVQETGATVMHYLGVMPGMLLNLPEDPRERRHALRFGFGGGVRAADHQRFEERFGVPLIEAWAMTETGGAGTISTHSGTRHVGTGCIGRPAAQYSEAMVVDEQGRPLAPGLIGELVVRASGPDPRRGFFCGYYRNPEATELAWRGGWLHTGDLVRQNEEGCYFFVGRRKQIVRRSGENISAAEVESVLAACRNVRQAAVVPVPDEIREEEVFACVVPGGGLTPSQEAAEGLLQQMAEHLSYFKLPGYIAFVGQLPTTATQKLRYGAIIELARSLMSQRGPEFFDVRAAKRAHRASQGRPPHSP